MARVGVIFDLDGVLIDSEGLYYRAYSEVLKPYGVTISQEEYEQHWIATGTGPEYIVSKHKLPVSPGELRKLRSPVYLRLLEEVRLMLHVESALARLAPHFALTVATNSNRDALDLILQRFGLERFFAVTVARQDYTGAKPLPDAFLAAAGKLGLTPAQCVVVEDTHKGVIAAVHAGIACIAVPNQYTRRNDFSKADLLLSDLGALSPAVVRRLVRL